VKLTRPAAAGRSNLITRRSILRAGLTIAGTSALTFFAGNGTAAAAQSTGRRGTATRSLNGWPVVADAPLQPIDGSNAAVRLTDGAPAILLGYVARRYNYEIETLEKDDLRGFSANAVLTEEYESTYRSGTGMTIRAEAYPLGVAGGFYPTELIVIRDILAELDGAVAWGGDYLTPKESHFHIARRPGDPALERTAIRIASAGTGAPFAPGVVDAFVPARRAASQAFERESRR